MDKEAEKRVRAFIESKIRFTPKTKVSGIKNFELGNKKHHDLIIKRILKLADKAYAGGGPSLNSHKPLNSAWTVKYRTEEGAEAEKEYISPIEVLSPFNSKFINEVEILWAGSDD